MIAPGATLILAFGRRPITGCSIGAPQCQICVSELEDWIRGNEQQQLEHLNKLITQRMNASLACATVRYCDRLGYNILSEFNKGST